MATYSVHAECSKCTAIHPMSVIVEIANGPELTSSLTEATAAHPGLTEFARHLHGAVFCRLTGLPVRQRDDDKIFLVPENN